MSFTNIPPQEIPKELKDFVRSLPDSYWKNKIFSCLFAFLDSTNAESIQILVNNSLHKPEKTLKQFLKAFLEKNEDFDNDFDIETEPDSNNTNIEGKYDIKILNSYWRSGNAKGYLVFECKCIYGSDSKNPRVEIQESDLKEYVYNPSTKDGGVYRFLTGKYAYNSTTNQALNFGGMIGFLLKGNIEKTIDAICERLRTEKYGREENYPESAITRQSIENQPFTFDSTHQRFIIQKPDADPILLHHLIFDFTVS